MTGGWFLIGDPANPLQKWLIKPFADTGRLTQAQQRYNYRNNSAMSVVETTFGCVVLTVNPKWQKNGVNICEENGDCISEDLHADMHENMQPPGHAVPHHGQQKGADVQTALMH